MLLSLRSPCVCFRRNKHNIRAVRRRPCRLEVATLRVASSGGGECVFAATDSLRWCTFADDAEGTFVWHPRVRFVCHVMCLGFWADLADLTAITLLHLRTTFPALCGPFACATIRTCWIFYVTFRLFFDVGTSRMRPNCLPAAALMMRHTTFGTNIVTVARRSDVDVVVLNVAVLHSCGGCPKHNALRLPFVRLVSSVAAET